MKFFDMFQYAFMNKAFLMGALIALCCSCLGLFLVLRKYSMIGDGLGHVSFASVAVALLVGASDLIISIPMVTIASFLIYRFSQKKMMHGDAAIGLISATFMALGVFIASQAEGFNADILSYLFGSILAISDTDVYIALILAPLVLALVLFFYHTLVFITYDEDFSRVLHVRVNLYNYLLLALTSVTVVLGIRVVGSLLISSLIIFPAVTALQISRGFRSSLVISSLISVSCVIIGITLAFFLNWPAGATIVLLNGIAFLCSLILKRLLRR